MEKKHYISNSLSVEIVGFFKVNRNNLVHVNQYIIGYTIFNKIKKIINKKRYNI